MKPIYTRLSLAVAGLFLASCGPIILEPAAVPRNLPPAPTATTNTSTSVNTTPYQNPTNQTVTSAAQKAERQTTYQSTTTPSVQAPSIPTTSNYPVALPIPGKPGYVYNPYNNNPVYVQGIPSGKTVRDPKDINTDHKFRVP